jgi:hypothetical protein
MSRAFSTPRALAKRGYRVWTAVGNTGLTHERKFLVSKGQERIAKILRDFRRNPVSRK